MKSTVNEIETEMKAQFAKVNSANMKIIQAMKGEDAKEEISWFVGLRTRYQTSMEVITNLKDKNCAKKVDSSAANKGCNFQLQKIPMTSFNGDIRDYPSFKNDLLKYVLPCIENTDASSYVLSSCLKGEPLQLVKNVGDDIGAMWRRLDEVYGNPAKVVDIIMNEIKRLEPVAENDYCGLIALIDMVESGYMDLARLQIEGEISNCQFSGRKVTS